MAIHQMVHLQNGASEKRRCSDSIWNFRVPVLQRQAPTTHESLAKIQTSLTTTSWNIWLSSSRKN